MKIREYIQVKAAGETTDPAVFCPIEGYYDPDATDSPVIWNPIVVDEWVFLTEFQTNSPESTTFDPTLLADSGEFAWVLGDGSILLGDKSPIHTYSDSSTKTVKIYIKGTAVITNFQASDDNIIGALDLSNSEFIALQTIAIYNNTGLTSLVLPSSNTGIVGSLQIYNTGITGALDLSILTTFNTVAQILLGTNPAMTSIIFASAITGTVAQLQINSTGITGTLDLSMFTTFNAAGSIQLNSNPSMTGLLFSSSITGTFSVLYIYSTGITGTLDLSMFTAFGATANIQLQSNASMTGLAFASTITGTINLLYIYSTGITGVLDLSMFSIFVATATVYLNNNSALTGISFAPSTISGFIRTLRMYSNPNLGYVDLTKLRTGVNSLNWDMKNNAWTAAEVNRVLVDIDSISVGGFTSRVINIGGTNADPDTTSGGYNGSAARTSLQGKGFTVTIT